MLNENQVKYLVIGGYAVAIHGHPRYTKDIDIWIEISEDNANRLVTTLIQFGFESLGLTAQDFQTANQIIQLGYPPNRIDLQQLPIKRATRYFLKGLLRKPFKKYLGLDLSAKGCNY